MPHQPSPPLRPLPGPAVRPSADPPLWPGDITLEPGYTIEAVAAGLTFPSDLTFDDGGQLYVAEAGVALGSGCASGRGGGGGRILRVEEDGSFTEIAVGFDPPLAALTWHEGTFYVAEGACPGRITRVWPGRGGTPRRETIVDGLRSGGDHGISQIAFGPNGRMYFGVGSATNAAVVGIDNHYLGRWLPQRRAFHDVPARDLVLRGLNFASVDPAEVNPLTEVLTGPYLPFGTTCRPEQRVEGALTANSVLYEADPDGGSLRVYLDGVRAVGGVAFSPDGRLFFTEQGFEVRGSRPIAGLDALWEGVPGGWYGYPDYSGGVPVIHPRFRVEGCPPPDFVLADHPPLATQPAVVFHHGSVPMKFDFSRGGVFGYEGWAFIPMFGSLSPPGGQKPRVVRLNVETGRSADLLVINNPMGGGDGPWRPAAVRFNADGSALYLLDYGPVFTGGGAVVPTAGGGALWRIWSI
ncbi:MAG TPA: glucose dehydrogenase [Bacillota bacterium]